MTQQIESLLPLGYSYVVFEKGKCFDEKQWFFNEHTLSDYEKGHDMTKSLILEFMGGKIHTYKCDI